MTNVRASLLCLVLGALAALGFAPLQLWPLTVACLATWLVLVHDAGTMRAALWRGWLFGLAHFTINDNWFQHAFDFQDKMPPALGYAAPLLLALYLAVYPMFAAGLAWRFASPRSVGDRLTRPGMAFALVFGAAWIATEYLRATMFTGYAWDPLGVIWVPVQPVAWLTTLIGTYALGGLTIVLGGALIAARGVIGGIGAVATLGALIAAHYLGYAPPAEPAPPPGYPHLVVVQPDIGQDQRGDTDWPRMLRTLSALTPPPTGSPRLILWPEGVVRPLIEDGYPAYIYDEDPEAVRADLTARLGPADVLMAGGTTLRFDPRREPIGATNAIFALRPPGRIVARYDKAHLVPYGEYLPMRPLLSAIGLSRLVPGDIDFDPGPGPRTFSIDGFGPVGVQLCYEIIFSGEVIDPHARPRLLFNPSNDAWFGTWGPPQHLAQARMRAIEEGVAVVRATPTGISAVIGDDGRLIAAQPLSTAGTIDLPMPAARGPTMFARVGNAMAAITALALLLAALAVRRRRV